MVRGSKPRSATLKTAPPTHIYRVWKHRIVVIINQSATMAQISDSINTIQRFTPEDVSKHNTPDNLWTIIGNEIYDLTDFQKEHPGGAKSTPTLFMRCFPSSDNISSSSRCRKRRDKKVPQISPRGVVGEIQNITGRRAGSPAKGPKMVILQNFQMSHHGFP